MTCLEPFLELPNLRLLTFAFSSLLLLLRDSEDHCAGRIWNHLALFEFLSFGFFLAIKFLLRLTDVLLEEI